MPIGKRTIKRVVLYLTASIICLVLITPYLITPLINTTLVKTKISTLINSYSGVEIEPELINFRLTPLPGIQLNGIEHSFNEIFHIAIDAVNIDIDVMKLFDRKIAISRIEVEHPVFKYTPLKKSIKPTQAPRTLKPLQFKIPTQEIDTLFALFPNSQDSLEVIVKKAKSEYFDDMDGRFIIFKNKREMVFKAKGQGLRIAQDQFPDFNFFRQNGIKAIQAKDLSLGLRLDSTNTLKGTLNIIDPRVFIPKSLKHPLAAQTLDLKFILSKDLISATLAPAVITYPQANLSIEFSDTPRTKTSAITFTGQDVDIAQARQVCLPLIQGNEVVDSLFDILRAGKAKQILVGFKSDSLSTLFDGDNLYLKGSAAAARVKIPETELLAENVFGDAMVNKGVLSVTTSKGHVATTHIKNGTLAVDLMNHEDIPFKGRFNLETNLTDLPDILISLLPDTVLAEELALISKISGNADAVLDLEMAPGQEDLGVKVLADNITATGFYDRIPLPIKINHGQFFYDQDKITITDFSGKLGKSPINNINASVDIAGIPFLRIKTANSLLTLEEVMSWAKDHEPVMALLSPVQTVSGTLTLDQINITGPMFNPEKWQFNINGSGENNQIGFNGDTSSIQDFSGRFNLTDKSYWIKEITARITDLTWLGYTVESPNLASIDLPIHLFETSIKNDKNRALLHGKLTLPQGPLLSFDLAGNTLDTMFPNLIVLKDPGITDALIMPYQDPQKPRFSFEGTLNSLTLEKMLVDGSPLHNKLSALTQGAPISVSTDHRSQIHIETKKIDLDSLLAPHDKSDGKPGKESPKPNRPFLAQKSLFLKADLLTYLETEFSGVDTKINFDPDKTRIQIRNAGLCNLTANGIVDKYNGQSNKVVTEFNVHTLNGTNIATMLGCLFKTESFIQGPYSFATHLTGEDSSKLIARRQKGKMSFHAQDGRIHKATLLSRVLSVLNILGNIDIKQDGFGYKTIEIQADIKDSVIHLKKAYIDADNMAIIFSGWLDPLKDELNLTILVAPFKTVDTIIKNIPVVNTILSGRLVSFPAKATGKISDPTVVPLHPSAVGKGLVNLLKDLITAPGRLINKDETNESENDLLP